MHDYNFGCQNIIQLSKGKMLNQSEEFHSLADGLFLFVCLSGRLPRRKESGCLIRDSASRPGVGTDNTPYQVLQEAWITELARVPD